MGRHRTSPLQSRGFHQGGVWGDGEGGGPGDEKEGKTEMKAEKRDFWAFDWEGGEKDHIYF